MAARSILVRHEALERFVTALFTAKGMRPADAAIVAEVLVWANLRGADSHGVQRLPRYFEMIAEEEMDPRGEPRITVDAGAAFVLDARRTAGPVAMMQAMATAAERAKKHSVSFGIVREATHAGAIGRYTQWAAERGFAAIVMAAGLPLMAYPGGRTRALSTNPIAMAAPTGKHGTIALDMATSVVAAGRIVQARAKGERIPSDWALTEDGEPTTDPNKAVISLPLGGPKGAGLALMIELLTGALGGAPIMTKTLDLHGTRKAHQNALIVVIDIAALRPEAEYNKDADELGTLIKQLPRGAGVDEILLPGDRGRQTDAKRRRDGIPIPAATWKALEAVAAACAVALPEPLPAK